MHRVLPAMSLPENNVNYCHNYFSANQAQELVLVEQHPQRQICNVDEAGLCGPSLLTGPIGIALTSQGGVGQR